MYDMAQQQVRRKRQHVRAGPARTASTALPPRYSRRASPRRWRGSSSTRTTARTAASPTKAAARPCAGRRERPRPRCLQGIGDERRRDDGAAPALQEPRGGRQQVRQKRQHVCGPARTASTALPPRYSRRASPRRWRGSSSTRTTARTAASPTKAPARVRGPANAPRSAASKVFATSVAATSARLQLYKNYGADGLDADAFDSETTTSVAATAKAELDLNKYQAGMHALHAIEQVSYVQSETMVPLRSGARSSKLLLQSDVRDGACDGRIGMHGQAHLQLRFQLRASSGGLLQRDCRRLPARRQREQAGRRRRLGRRVRRTPLVGTTLMLAAWNATKGTSAKKSGPRATSFGASSSFLRFWSKFSLRSVGFRST